MSFTLNQKKLLQLGVALFGIGLLTGIWSALALSETVVVPIPRLALAAHLNGLLGGLWMIAVALTFPFLSYNEKQKNNLALMVTLPNWSNWFVTLIASFLGVRGINYNQDLTNNVVAVFLQLFVVIPSLAAAFYWYRGFKSKS